VIEFNKSGVTYARDLFEENFRAAADEELVAQTKERDIDAVFRSSLTTPGV
jgi:hypothetical protein